MNKRTLGRNGFSVGVSALVGEGGSPQGLVVPLTMDDFVWMLKLGKLK